jgi:type I restriction enzyme S subunit
MPTPAGAPPSSRGRVALGALLIDRPDCFDRVGQASEQVAWYSTAAFLRGMPDLIDASALRGRPTIARPGDVLLSRAAFAPRRAWVVIPLPGRTPLASGEWLIVRPREHDPGYLRHLLVSNEFHVRVTQAIGARAQASAASARLRAIELPVPPQPQQREIARLLDAADTLRAKRRRSLAAVNELEAALQETQSDAPRHRVEALRTSMMASRARLDALLGALRDRAYRGQLDTD